MSLVLREYDGQSADLMYLSFMEFLDNLKKERIFKYSVFCSPTNNEFYVHSIPPLYPLHLLKKVNDENIKSIKNWMKITRNLEEDPLLTPDSLKCVYTFDVFISKDKHGKLRIQNNLIKGPILKRLPDRVMNGINKISDDLERNNCHDNTKTNQSLQEDLQSKYEDHLKKISQKDTH